MADGAVALAVGAGMLAAVNPCGFALLPAYLSLLALGDQSPTRPRAAARALEMTTAMTLAFCAVFVVFGLLLSPVAAIVQRHLPWFTIALGLLLLGLGIWLLTGRAIPGLRIGSRGGSPARSLASMLGFGVSYALASLSCTIAPFLAVVVTAFGAGSVWAGVALFIAYAMGMGLVVGTAAVAGALANTSLLGRMRRLGRTVPQATGALLVLAGGYVAYYGWWEIRVISGTGSAQDPVVAVAGMLQQELVRAVDRLGIAGFTAILTALVGIALATALGRRRVLSRPAEGSMHFWRRLNVGGRAASSRSRRR